MPYPTLDSLPDAVKSIPKGAQEIWQNAYNSAEKEYPGEDNEDRRAKIAWGAVKNAGWAKDSEGEWKKENAKSFDFDAEIFSEGTWNGDKYVQKDLDEMVENFDILSDKVKPPVKLGHNDKWKDGLPALGWVKGLRRVGKKLIASLTNVPEIVYKAIKAGRYKRVSAEIFWNYKSNGQTFNRVLAGVALLGADIPAVDTLEDLDKFLSKDAGGFDEWKRYDLPVKDGQIYIKEVDPMDDQEKKDYEERLKKAEDAQKAAEAKNKQYEADNAQRLKDEETARQNKAEEDFKAFCEEQVEKGIMAPADRDKLVTDCTKYYSKESGQVVIPHEIFKTLQFGVKLDKREHARDTKDKEKAGDDVQSIVDQKAKEYARKNDVSYRDAVTAVLDEDTELARKYVSDINTYDSSPDE